MKKRGPYTVDLTSCLEVEPVRRRMQFYTLYDLEEHWEAERRIKALFRRCVLSAVISALAATVIFQVWS